MKIGIPSKDLKEAIARVAVAVSKRSVSEPTQQIVISAGKSSITLKSNNHDMQVIDTVDANVVREGEIAIAPDKFNGVLESSQDIVKIEAVEKGKNTFAKISFGKFNRQAQCFDLSKIPSFPEVDSGAKLFQLPSDDLLDAIKSVELAMPKSGHAYPELQAIRFECRADNCSLLATNKQRVHFKKLHAATNGAESFSLPSAAALALAKAIPGESDMWIQVSEKNVRFQWQTGCLTSKVLALPFPNALQFVAMAIKDGLKWSTVNRQDIMGPLSRVAAVGEFSNIDIEGREGKIKLAAKNKAEEAIDLVDMTGDDLEPSETRGEFLIDAIKSCPEDEFEIGRIAKGAFGLREKSLNWLCVFAVVNKG